MLDEKTVIYEYEEILMGKRTIFVSTFSKDETEREKKCEAGYIWKYAVTNLLKMSPQEARVLITDSIVDDLKLDKTLTGIGFNRSQSYHLDYSFMLALAFPDVIKRDMRSEAIEQYERTAKVGKWKNDTNKYKTPKRFYTDENGQYRAAVILNYLRNKLMGDMDIEEQYAFFSNKERATRWLNKHHLKEAIRFLYVTPLDFFHASLRIDEKDEFLYQNGIVKSAFEDIILKKEEQN